MAQLWGGRFTKETDKLVYNFNASIAFDQKFYRQDIEGSIAHVTMLGKQGILTEEEMQAIIKCLKEILSDVGEGRLAITDEYEDIHSFVEANLIDRLGDIGKKLHTGRSRNDQVALEMVCIPEMKYCIRTRCLRNFSKRFYILWRRTRRRSCRALRIFRKRSRSHWRITWELTLKCLSATVCVCMISMRE